MILKKPSLLKKQLRKKIKLHIVEVVEYGMIGKQQWLAEMEEFQNLIKN